MPVAALLFALDLALLIHVVKTGRSYIWASVILMAPGFGALAYIAAEIAPEWLGTYKGQKTQRAVGRALAPNRQYRILQDELATADTIYNRAALARECMILGRYEEALNHFASIVAHPQGEEPSYYLDKARAEFALERPQETLDTLNEMKRIFPDFKSGEAHLLYARATEMAGQTQTALREYEALSYYYLGAEAPVRRAMLLMNLGETDKAKEIASNVVAVLNRSPKHVRRAQAEWLKQAKNIAQA